MSEMEDVGMVMQVNRPEISAVSLLREVDQCSTEGEGGALLSILNANQ